MECYRCIWYIFTRFIVKLLADNETHYCNSTKFYEILRGTLYPSLCSCITSLVINVIYRYIISLPTIFCFQQLTKFIVNLIKIYFTSHTIRSHHKYQRSWVQDSLLKIQKPLLIYLAIINNIINFN